MPEGLGPPAHRHPLAIEGFYVLEGVVNFHVDGKTIRAEVGTFIHLPRMVLHTVTVESEETRVLNFYAPPVPKSMWLLLRDLLRSAVARRWRKAPYRKATK
jgi:quercetin dioxygenase-like cupin family protein